jgi:hypothetical protein
VHIFLHVGLLKTGTTSIQHVLSANAARLAETGFIYPASGRGRYGPDAHHNLAYELGAKFRDLGRFEEAQGGWNDCLSELKRSNAQHAIISSEAFSLLRSEEIKRLAEQLQDHSVTPVLYLRRQDQWLHSHYLQLLRFARTAFDADSYICSGLRDVSHREVISMWRGAFGNSNVKTFLYQPDSIGPNAVLHFTAFCGILPSMLKDVSVYKNQRPKLKALIAAQVIQRRFRMHTPNFDLPREMAMQTSRFFRTRPDFTGSYSLFNAEQARTIMRHYVPENQWIAAEIREEFSDIGPSEYDDYVENPLDLAANFDDEESAFIERAVKAVDKIGESPKA